MLVPKTSTISGSLPGALPINILDLKVGVFYCDLMQTRKHAWQARNKRFAAPNALILTSILGINPKQFVVHDGKCHRKNVKQLRHFRIDSILGKGTKRLFSTEKTWAKRSLREAGATVRLNGQIHNVAHPSMLTSESLYSWLALVLSSSVSCRHWHSSLATGRVGYYSSTETAGIESTKGLTRETKAFISLLPRCRNSITKGPRCHKINAFESHCGQVAFLSLGFNHKLK